MKLVEILAREMGEWPEGALFVDQASDGDLIANFDSSCDVYAYLGIHELSEDWTDSQITRLQWQAERERIAKMEELSELSIHQTHRGHPQPKGSAMTVGELMELAREAGFQTGSIYLASGCDSYPLIRPIGENCAVELERFANAIMEREREACALVCLRMSSLKAAIMDKDLQDACAEAIRSRSTQDKAQ